MNTENNDINSISKRIDILYSKLGSLLDTHNALMKKAFQSKNPELVKIASEGADTISKALDGFLQSEY